MRRTPDKLPEIYLYLTIVVTNTFAAIFLANIALSVVFYIKDFHVSIEVQAAKPTSPSKNGLFNEDGSPVDNGKRFNYQLEWFDFNAYEKIAPHYAAEVLDGFWALSKLGFMYQPWVGFAEPPFISKLVNVDVDGHGFPIRRTINPRNDPVFPTVRIFVLGGSTTFGYNVSDEHTWPSHLSNILNERAQSDRLGINVEVINYGRGFFYPSQETALLIDLLKSGQRPNLVIFMDGSNGGSPQDIPQFTEEMADQMQRMQFRPPLTEALTWIPIVRMADALGRRLVSGAKPTIEPKVDKGRRMDNLVNMFRHNQDISMAVSNVYGVHTLFFLGPNVAYYSPRLFRKALPATLSEDREQTLILYKRLRERGQMGPIDLAGLFDEWGERKAIVDNVHYSPAFSEFLARRVAQYIDLESLQIRPMLLDESAATGEPRR